MLRTLHSAWANLRMRFAHAASGDNRRLAATLDALVWLAAFLLYAATTARDVLAADSGEFQLTAAGWGIAHPPGYPLYTVVSALWVRLLPLGTLPFRANLLSAVLAATALVLCFRAIRTWARALGADTVVGTVGGLTTALALGTAATFWAQATTANIRMPTVLFTAWGYLALAQFHAAVGPAAGDRADRRREDATLLNLALATGLGIGHHPSLAFVAVGWALALVLLKPNLIVSPSRWLRPAALAVAAWCLPQLYLPLRGGGADAPLSPGDLATWQGFWDHVLARGFGGDMFAFATGRDLALRLPLLPSLYRLQFPSIILIAMAAAWLVILWKDRRIATALLVPWAVHSFVTITYRAPQTVEYLMPAYVPMALALGLGLALLSPRRAITSLGPASPRAPIEPNPPAFGPASLRAPARPRSDPAARDRATTVLTIIILILAAQLPSHVRDFTQLAGDTSIRDYVQPLLAAAPADALVLADWRWATPLWVLQATEDRAPEVDVIYVTPEPGLDYEEVWRRTAQDAGDRPLFVTHAYAWEDWSAAPVGGGLRLYRPPLPSLPTDLGFTPLDAELGPIRILGVRWRGTANPGSSLELQIAWEARPSSEGRDRTPSFATRLWDPDGNPISAADQSLDDATPESGVHFTRLTHQLPIDRCTAAVYPTIDVYTVTDERFEGLGSVSLPELVATCTYPTLPTRRPWPGVAWPGGPLLRGVDYDVRADGSATVYLHWCGPGDPLLVGTPTSQAHVGALARGQCRTTSLPTDAPEELDLELRRPDGAPVTLVALPLPGRRPDERYMPFGKEMVLVDDRLRQVSRGTNAGTTLLTLRWLTARPIVQDYAVSVRLLAADGTWLGAHDIQPGLGAIPTLKWVVQNRLIRDPHPVEGLETTPVRYSVVVYDRFRLTPLRSAQGDAGYQLP